MDLSSNKKLFNKDNEVSGIKDSEMIRKRDAQERDQFAKRLLEKDREGKNKITKHNTKGVTLTETEKFQILPQLRMESRMKFLEKREKQKL